MLKAPSPLMWGNTKTGFTRPPRIPQQEGVTVAHSSKLLINIAYIDFLPLAALLPDSHANASLLPSSEPPKFTTCPQRLFSVCFQNEPSVRQCSSPYN